jgi:signal transduction histidine kinase
MVRRNPLLIVWLLFVPLRPSLAAGKQLPVLPVPAQKVLLVSQYFRYLPDGSKPFSYKQARAKILNDEFLAPAPKKVFNLGYTGVGSYWFALDIQNGLQGYQQQYWSVANQIDSAILFTFDMQGHLMQSDTVRNFTPVADRQLKLRRIAFSLELNPGERRLYLMHLFNDRRKWYLPVWLEPILLPSQNIAITLGVHLGIYLFVASISLILFTYFRRKIYLWYTAYMVSFLLFVAIDEHLIVVFFSNISLIKYLYEVSPYAFIIFCLACNIRIMQLLCRQNKQSKMYIPANIIWGINLLIALFYAIIPFIGHALGSSQINALILFSVNAIIPASLSILLLSVVEQALQRNSTAIYYLLAIFCLSFGIVNYYFNYLGVSNFVLLTPNGLIVGVTVEVAILSLLIGKDYRQLKEEQRKLLVERGELDLKHAVELVTQQENERARIARDLHDDVGATLSIAKLYLSRLGPSLTVESASNHLYQDLIILFEKATREVRTVSQALLPVDLSLINLFDAMEARISQLNNAGTLHFEAVLTGDDFRLPQNQATNVFRIANELFTNVLKHSNADKAFVQLHIAETLQLTVEDNGRGMRESGQGLGLRNIRARVSLMKGTFHIDSNASGTTAIIVIPVHHDDK